MSGQKVGYIRVSHYDQQTHRQLDGILLDKIFIDKASGKDVNRPQLTVLLDFVREEDTVVVHSMDRLARNLDDLRNIVQTLTKKGVCVEFVKESLKFTCENSPIATLMLSVMGSFAEFERALIRERQREGIVLAQKRGVYKGRKKSLNDDQIKELVMSVQSNPSPNKSKIAKEFGISRETLYKYVNSFSINA